MSTPLYLGKKPKWLATQTEDDVANTHYKRSIRYYEKLYKARCAGWVDAEKVAEIYRECKRRRNSGEKVQVDHIVPISHPYVCGLHNEFNLQILTERENLSKGNRFWPDMWGEQLGLPIPMQDKELWVQENTEEKDRRVSTQEQTSLPLLQAGYLAPKVHKRKGIEYQEEMPL